jgi:hypothetical protein
VLCHASSSNHLSVYVESLTYPGFSGPYGVGGGKEEMRGGMHETAIAESEQLFQSEPLEPLTWFD